MMGLQNITGAIFKGSNEVNKFVQTGEERDKVISDRHAIDMKSDDILSKRIRPITLIWLLALESLIIILGALGYQVGEAIVAQVGMLLVAVIGFYFNSKKHERIAEKNATANIKLEEAKQKRDFKLEKKEIRADRKAKRRRERKQDRED